MKGRRWSWRSADKALGVWHVFPVWAVVAVSIVACVAGVNKAGASCPPPTAVELGCSPISFPCSYVDPPYDCGSTHYAFAGTATGACGSPCSDVQRPKYKVWAILQPVCKQYCCVVHWTSEGVPCPPDSVQCCEVKVGDRLVGTWLEFDGCENCPGAEA